MTSGWQPAEAYPDPAIITLDPRFDAIKPPMNAGVERLYTGCRWAEGPVWFGDMRVVLWSDIPNNRILRWDEETGQVSVFRKPSNYANGNTRDRQGRLVTCEHGGRQITRTEHDDGRVGIGFRRLPSGCHGGSPSGVFEASAGARRNGRSMVSFLRRLKRRGRMVVQSTDRAGG